MLGRFSALFLGVLSFFDSAKGIRLEAITRFAYMTFLPLDN